MIWFFAYLFGITAFVKGMSGSPDQGGETAALSVNEDEVVASDGQDTMFGNTNDDTVADHSDMQDMNDQSDMSSGDMSGHDDHSDMSNDSDSHDHHDMANVDLPTTDEEILEYVAMIRAMEETHVHDADSDLLGEHMELLDLVPRDEATHIAISNGAWDDPSIWHNGEVPGDNAKVLVPEGVSVDYEHTSDARIFTIRIDGDLTFATDADSKVVVDTFVVSPTGSLTIGTEETPVEADVSVDIIIANNGAIDTDWDPTLLSRGLISHGDVTIHGAVKDSHEKVSVDPMAGDTSVTFETIPEGWQVGDTIVIAGTEYEGYTQSNTVFNEPEDEVRTILHIDGNTVHFADPLVHDHDTPRDDLFTSVANYTRNISIETEDADSAEVFERGHVMFMHSDNVDVRYMEFHELGRTDKSVDLFDADEDGGIAFDSNVSGRYSVHLHRLGVDDLEDPALLIGNAVTGSPGWGYVHHDSNALLDNNASYDTFGAGFVAETGNETGTWTDNIAIFAQGVGWGGAKGLNDAAGFDIAKSGDGFWFQGRMVDAENNVAASVNHGFVYFHRGPTGDDGMIPVDASVWYEAEALYYNDEIAIDDIPIMSFSGNETFAARMGMHVVKANPKQGHDVHSVLEDFTGWNVYEGANLQYTSHYVIKDFDLIALEGEGGAGISFGSNAFDMVIDGITVEGFDTGIDLFKKFTDQIGGTEDQHSFVVINPTLINNGVDYENYDAALDTILTGNISKVTPTITLDAPLSFNNNWPDEGSRTIEISGTKTDSLGTEDFPSGPDNFDLDHHDVIALLEENGYYTASDGNNYFILNIYFSDRLTGDVYRQPELVELDESVQFENSAFENAQFNGNIAYGDLQDMVSGGSELVMSFDSIELVHQVEDYASMTGEALMKAIMNDPSASTEMDTASDHSSHMTEMETAL